MWLRQWQQASQIILNGTLKIEGGLTGALGASSFAGGFFSPLLLGGPFGDVAYIVVVGGAGIGGAILGEKAVQSLLEMANSDAPNKASKKT